MAKIHIRKLGPIEEFEMEPKQINLLIGEQATGKSTVAKSIYFFKRIKKIARDYLVQLAETGLYNGQSVEGLSFYKATQHTTKEDFISLFGYSMNLDPEMQMKYEYSDSVWIEVTVSKDIHRYLNLKYSPSFSSTMKKLSEEAQKCYTNKQDISQMLMQEQREKNRAHIYGRVNELFSDEMETYYIPAGRSFLTVLSANKALMSSFKNLDMITEEFMSLIDGVRNAFLDGYTSVIDRYSYKLNGVDKKEIEMLFDWVQEMQKGEYFSNNGEALLIRGQEDRKIGINYTSSGQQEILWLLNYLLILMLNREKACVIIEEPEAHIYPSLQKSIMEFIVHFANREGSHVVITTHSPYILSAANNLYYAGHLSAQGLKQETKTIVPVEKQIKDGELNAFKMMYKKSGSQADDLLLSSDGEFAIDRIDEVSSEINKDYTSLYNIYLDSVERNTDED